jgi:hypothetical protein
VVLSNELKLLLLSYNVTFHSRHVEKFRQLFHTCDQQKLIKLLIYHEVRPVFYNALLVADIPCALREQLKNYLVQLALKTKIYEEELKAIRSNALNLEIAIVPYKGIYFNEKLYPSGVLREFSDLDLLVPQYAQTEAFIMDLCSRGYALESGVDLEDVLLNAKGREVSLEKEGWAPVHLDVHWGINEAYHHYPLRVEDFIVGKSRCESQVLFYMLLNHHGAREQWLKLKDLFDLARYMESFPDSPTLKWAEDIKMKTIFSLGKELVEEYILDGEAFHQKSFLKKYIIKNWESAISYRQHFRPKMNKLLIYLTAQDKGVSKTSLAWDYIKHHSSYNPVNKLQKGFNSSWGIINFPVKVVKMLYQMLTGKYNK